MAEEVMTAEWLRSEIIRIIHRKFHTTDDQNGKCYEAAEQIISLLPLEDMGVVHEDSLPLPLRSKERAG